MTTTLSVARPGATASAYRPVATMLLALSLGLAPTVVQTQALPAGEEVLMASTTSTEQSGLFGFLLPRLTAATGIQVKVVAVGTGQALDMARRGDADMLLVHDPKAEQKFVDDGFGIERREVMYNDFIIVGPKQDPAGIAGTKSNDQCVDEDRRGKGAVHLAW